MNVVDTENSIIRDASVITAGVVARGHGLLVDVKTLEQMKACADEKVQVPVKIDHSAGAAGICGFLSNFRIVGLQLLADWHLLHSHPQTIQILETAKRMPRGVGLSAAFVSPDDAERGRARCSELVSVDLVTSPAANPDGLFATINGKTIEFSTRGARILRAGLTGGAVGLLSHISESRGKPLLRQALTSAARDGAIAAGTVYVAEKIKDRETALKKTKPAEMSAVVSAVMFGRDPAIHRVIDATERNLPRPEISVPYLDQAKAAGRIVKKSPLARRLALRAGRIAVAAGTGAYLGHRIAKRGVAAGAAAGALAGVLFSENNLMKIELGTKVNQRIDRYAQPTRAGAHESQTLDSLSRRICASKDQCQEFIARGALKPQNEIYQGDRTVMVFSSDDLNAVRRLVLEHVAAERIQFSRGGENQLLESVEQALKAHVTKFAGPKVPIEFSKPFVAYDEEEPSLADRAAKTAAVVGGAALLGGGAAYLRGRAALGKTGAPILPGVAGMAQVIKAGGSALAGDAVNLLKKARLGAKA